MDDNLISILEEQEKVLRFSAVSYSELAAIGNRIVSEAAERGWKVYVMIRIAGFTVFASAMDGVSANNAAWARRKANTAELTGRSSMRDGLIYRAKGQSLSDRGLSSLDYTDAGGSFPVLLESGAAIGSITVSGMASEEDHQLIADVLSAHLGRDIPSVI